MAEVSIIIPVYNVAKYLHRCLDSIVNQTFKDIEIVIVDDGSTDESLRVCKEYKYIDNRILLIHKDNGGLSSARNKGLEYVSSKYVIFVDSDDYIHKDMVKVLYENIQSNSHLDTVFCSFYKETKFGNIIPNVQSLKTCDIVGKEQTWSFFMDMVGSRPEFPHTAKYFMTVWHGIYSIKIIKENSLTFKNYISEDIIFHSDYLQYSHGVRIIPNCLYYYCWNGGSLSNVYKKDRFSKDLEVYNYLNKKFTLSEQKLYLCKYLILRARIDILDNLRCKVPSQKAVVNISEILKSNEMQDILRKYPYMRLSLKHRLFFQLMKFDNANLLYYVLKFFNYFAEKK